MPVVAKRGMRSSSPLFFLPTHKGPTRIFPPVPSRYTPTTHKKHGGGGGGIICMNEMMMIGILRLLLLLLLLLLALVGGGGVFTIPRKTKQDKNGVLTRL